MTMNKWQKETQRRLDRLESQHEKELVGHYQIALKELRGKISKLYEDTNGSWVEAQKYNRLTKLEKEIAQEIGKLTGKNAQTLKKGMMDAYEESYYSTAYVLSNEVKSDLGFSMLDRKLVEKAIENPLDRVGFLQRNRDNQQRLTRQLREQLTQGLIQGEAYGTVAKRIKGRMDVGASNAMTIARTENHRTRQRGKLESMREGADRGITLKKEWIATIDDKTRDRHGDLDGVQVDVDKPFKIDGMEAEAPSLFGNSRMDINCRCSMIEVVENFKPNTRRVKGIGITEYKTFNQFKKEGLIPAE
ncbi:phage minor head protein [Virgibacillus sp. CBA3643]|uniref:phage head morphogenesis protein n=1 Tax=Virgibacillus sp. CBA3643 TaxID=2942278 RepID=UPI0035A2FC41